MSAFEIDGSVPVIPIPVTQNGGLEWTVLASLLEFAISVCVCEAFLPVYADGYYKPLGMERHNRAHIYLSKWKITDLVYRRKIIGQSEGSLSEMLV